MDNLNNSDNLGVFIYTIKTINTKLPNSIKLVKNKYIDILFPELYNDMCLLKSKIDEPEYLKMWDKAKRDVNPYEIVNVSGTNILQPDKINISQPDKINISQPDKINILQPDKINYYNREQKTNNLPLSRSFFKLTEIWKLINLIPERYKYKDGVISNIAEGPGGFIEAIYKQRITNGINDIFYAITLYSKNKNIPGWNKILQTKNHFLNNNKNIILKTGNLYKKYSILNYSNFFKEKKAFLVTCDGGFDNSDNYNNQEKKSIKIIFAEIITTLLVQEKGGNMICKFFDIFTYFSVQLIYLLSICYEKINIIKPVTSRPANSEKYIIVSGFKFNYINKKFINSMLNELEKFDTFENVESCDIYNKYYGIKINNLNVPIDFIDEINTINISLVNNQKKYIIKTLDYIKNYNINDKLNNKYYQIVYSNMWFNKYNILKKENL